MATRPIYSTQLAIGYGVGGGTLSFLCPATVVCWVIRNMDFIAPAHVPNAPLQGFRVDLGTSAGAQTGSIWQCYRGNVWSNRSYHWRGRAVINSGQAILVLFGDAGWSFNISGYSFTS